MRQSRKQEKNCLRIFIQTRLVEKSISIHAPIKRNKTKTFAHLQSTVKVKISKKHKVEIAAQINLFGQLMLSEDNDLDVQKVMEYPL